VYESSRERHRPAHGRRPVVPYRPQRALTHCNGLEPESIHILREVRGGERPVMLYSIGKDSAGDAAPRVKRFYPALPPFRCCTSTLEPGRGYWKNSQSTHKTHLSGTIHVYLPGKSITRTGGFADRDLYGKRVERS